MVTRRRAGGTNKASAVSDLLQQAAKERVAAKKVRDEERKAEEIASKVATKTKALANEESLRNTSKENNETVISPESVQTNDSPDERINSHLLDMNNPKSDAALMSPEKIKRKTDNAKKSTSTSATIKSALRHPKNTPDPLQEHLHSHTRTLILASLKATPTNDSEDLVLPFVSGVRALVVEMKKVDPNVVIDHLYNAKDFLSDPNRIPLNQTEFGSRFKISTYGTKNPFNKQKQKDDNNYNNNRKKKSKEEEWTDPMVYFQFSISSDVPPEHILDRVRNEWFRIGGVKLEVKEIQALNVKTTHVIYHITTRNDIEVLIQELNAMMESALELTEMDDSDSILVFKDIPKFTMRHNIPRMLNQDTKNFNKLSYEVKTARRAYHIECDATDAEHLSRLISYVKEVQTKNQFGSILEMKWGRLVRISEILTEKASPIEKKNMLKYSQSHSNYNMSMTEDTLIGVTDVDIKLTLTSNATIQIHTNLREMLLQYFRYPGGDNKLFAEVHQGTSPGSPVTVVVPNTPEAEQIIANLNKCFPTVAAVILSSQGFPEELINEMIKKCVCPTHVAKMNNYTYDDSTRTLTAITDDDEDKALLALTNAPWFKTEFNMSSLLKDKKKKATLPPEHLFDIDATQTLATLHEKGRKLAASATPRKKKKKKTTKVKFPMESLSSSSSKKSLENTVMSINSDSSNSSSSSSNSSSSNNNSDKDSTSLHDSLRSNPQATIGVETTPPAPIGVFGSAQGSAMGG